MHFWKKFSLSNKGPHSFSFQFHNKKNIDLSKKNMKGKLLCFLIKKAEPALGLIVTNLLGKKIFFEMVFQSPFMEKKFNSFRGEGKQ